MAKSYEEKQQESYLGIGWKEDPFTRELVKDRSGDLSSVAGLTNIGNAMYRRLRTPLGWYPEYPWYGSRLNEMKGLGNTEENRALIETWVEESLLYENRIVSGSLTVRVDKNPRDFRAVDIVITCRLVNYADPSLYVYSFFLVTGNLVETETETA